MDGRQFDRLARELGSGRSRRSIVKGMAAGIFGAVAGVRALRPASAGIPCANEGATCSLDGDRAPMCCQGYDCVQGENGLTCVAPPPPCSELGAGCGEGCCAGLVCASDDFCYLEVTWCGETSDPCDYYEGDVLVECCPGFACTDSGEGMTCQITCHAEGDSCGQVVLGQENGTSECCDGLICTDESICAPPPPDVTCAGKDASCAELACCGDLACLDSGVCGYPPGAPEVPVVRLPDTGAGQGGEGNDWLIPTALGAAAAAVAAHKLREERMHTSDDPA